MTNNKTKPQQRTNAPHEAILLSKAIIEKLNVSVTFLDGEVLNDGVKWHTPYHIGLKQGKVVSKSAVKYWEVVGKEISD